MNINTFTGLNDGQGRVSIASSLNRFGPGPHVLYNGGMAALTACSIRPHFPAPGAVALTPNFV